MSDLRKKYEGSLAPDSVISPPNAVLVKEFFIVI